MARCILTDQAYVARLVEQNLAENRPAAAQKRARLSGMGHKGKARRGFGPGARSSSRGSLQDTLGAVGADTVGFAALDWELDAVTASLLTGSGGMPGFDAVIACDCIYNEALVEPLVVTCVDACALGRAEDVSPGSSRPCVCIVAQQLRDPDVFTAWLERFTLSFHTWRMPDPLLVEGLRSNSGFVVHLGVLRDRKGRT